MDTGWIQRTQWADSSPGSSGVLNADSDVSHNLAIPVTELSVQLFFSATGSDDDAVPAPLGWMHRPVDDNAVRIYTQSTGPVYQGLNGPTPTDGQTGYYKIVVAPLAGTESTQERIYYDTVGQGRRTYPLTVSDLRRINRGNAPRVVGAWGDFTDCSWEVRNYTTNQSSVHSFPTIDDFVTWKNFNIPFAGPPPLFTEHIDLAPFDVIDRGIPVLSRMYGINNLYVALRGGNNKSGFNSFRGGSSQFSDVKADVFNHFWPARSFTAPMLAAVNGRSACWTPRNHSKMYSMPKVGEMLFTSLSGGAQRYCARETSETFSPLVTSDFLTFHDFCIIRLDGAGTGYTIWDNFSASNGKSIRRAFFNGANDSFFVVYKVQGSGTPGNQQICTFWKPLGIDRLWLEYFDTTKYRMEYVWWNTNDMQPDRFGKILSFNGGSGSLPYAGTGQFINKSQWMPSSSRWTSNLAYMKYSNRLRVYFRLRDLTTGKVGPLSSAHVEIVMNQTNAPIKLLVKQDLHGG